MSRISPAAQSSLACVAVAAVLVGTGCVRLGYGPADAQRSGPSDQGDDTRSLFDIGFAEGRIIDLEAARDGNPRDGGVSHDLKISQDISHLSDLASPDSGPPPPTKKPVAIVCTDQVVELAVPSSSFQQVFDSHTKTGHHVQWHDVFVSGSSELHTAIFTLKPQPTAWEDWFGKPLADYQQVISSYASTGYTPVNVDVVELNGQLRYTITAHKLQSTPFVHAEQLTEAKHKTYVATLTGYRPLAISYAESGGVTYVTSVHEKSTTGRSQSLEHLSPAAFAQQNSSLSAQLLYLTQLDAYTKGGATLISGVYADIAYTKVQFIHDLDAQAMTAEVSKQCSGSSGLPLRLVVGYLSNKQILYAGFWAK